MKHKWGLSKSNQLNLKRFNSLKAIVSQAHFWTKQIAISTTSIGSTSDFKMFANILVW